MKPLVKAHLAVGTANLLFGANFAMVKFVSPSVIAPFALNLVRALTCALLMWTLVVTQRKQYPPLQRRHLPRLLACAATGITVNQLLFIKGLTLTTAIHGALLMLVTPLLISLMAILFLGEVLRWTRVAGLLCGSAGAALLIVVRSHGGPAADEKMQLLGDVLVVLNAVSYSAYFILVKPLMQHYKPFQVITWLFTLGMLMMLPFAWQDLAQTDFGAFEPKHWWALAFVVFGATFLAYVFNIFGVHIIGPSATSTYMYTQPVFATILAILFAGEHMDWIKAASAALIFLGVYLVNHQPRPAAA
jgi:drug/metabolite transporter (DMT)-like permease